MLQASKLLNKVLAASLFSYFGLGTVLAIVVIISLMLGGSNNPLQGRSTIEQVSEFMESSITVSSQESVLGISSDTSYQQIDTDLKVRSEFVEDKVVNLGHDSKSTLKQLVFIENTGGTDQTVGPKLSYKLKTGSDTVYWMGAPIDLTQSPRELKHSVARGEASSINVAEFEQSGDAPVKSYSELVSGDSIQFHAPKGQYVDFSWNDIVNSGLGYTATISMQADTIILEFQLEDVKVESYSELLIDPTISLDTSSGYHARFDGDNQIGARGMAVGDFNNDGNSDMVIAGYAGTYLIFGDTFSGDLPLTTSTNYNIRFTGATPIGFIVGDFDYDGVDDLLAYGSTSTWIFYSTLLDDYDSTTGNNLDLTIATSFSVRIDPDAAISPTGAPGYGGVGDSVAIGDINEDGIDDLILGHIFASATGSYRGVVYVYFSTLLDDYAGTSGNILDMATTTTYSARILGEVDMDRIGMHGALEIGDVDGDTFNELFVGSLGLNSQSGGFYIMPHTVFSALGTTTGNDIPLSTSSNYQVKFNEVIANAQLSRYHNSIIGDVNGDGFDDLVVGSRDYDAGGTDRGSVYVFFSTKIDDYVGTGNVASLGVGTNYNIRYEGATNSSYLGDYGPKIADVNESGSPDLLLPAPRDTAGGGVGSLYVIYDSLLASYGTSTGSVRNMGTGSNYNIRYDGQTGAGNYITDSDTLRIGDYNNDGDDDIFVGTPTSSGAQLFLINSNLVSAISGTGNTRPLNNSSNYDIQYTMTDGFFGFINGNFGATDIDGNGENDVYINSRQANYGGASTGALWLVYSGLAPSPTPTPTFTLTPTPTSTLTPTPTFTLTPTPTFTLTPTPTFTLTPTPTFTLTPTPTFTLIPTPTPSNTPVPTVSSSPTPTPSSTLVPPVSISPTVTSSAVPLAILTSTPSPTPTVTASPTDTPEVTSFVAPADVEQSITLPETGDEASESFVEYFTDLLFPALGIFEDASENYIPVSLSAVAITSAVVTGIFGVTSSSNMILTAFFWIRVRKKQKPWGIVYDSEARKAIAFANVRLMQGDTIVAETVSDLDGKYFLLASPGNYSLHAFTSEGTSNPVQVVLKAQEELVATDIELSDRRSESLWIVLKKNIYFINNIVFTIGFVFACVAVYFSFSAFNFFVLVFYAVQLLLFVVKRPRYQGYIYSQGGTRISGAFVRVFSQEESRQIEVAMTDDLGRYRVNLEKGDYLVSVSAPGYQLPDSVIESDVFEKTGQRFMKASHNGKSSFQLPIKVDRTSESVGLQLSGNNSHEFGSL